MLSSQKLFKSRLPENLSAISEVSWGILMYSYVRARDAKGALHVLNRARAWLQNQPALDSKTCTPANRCYNKSSHLVNMAMSILVDCKDSTGALSLLDTYIARYAEAQESSSPLLMQNELPATPADPITLNLVLRALLLNNQLQHAVTVYDTIHSHFGHIGAPAELKLLLQYCIAKHDSRSAFPIIKRILQLKGTLTSAELLHLIRICVDDAKPEPVVYLYDQLCVSDDGSIDKGSRLVKLMKSRTSIARCIFWALRENGREADAVAIEVMLDRLQNRSTDCAATSLPLLSNATVAHTKHQCVSLYRRFLHEINVFPHTNLRKKLRYNVRFVFELYRDLKPSDPLALQLIADGRRQLKWLSSKG
ncbi:hypothetical protein EDC05_005043 [Coemansia umbellata]|uniref:Complex 1 LYR protein domain-containing protein n=1 Tax=Coemansia umbellata TaxID=1424467 RepID=A0ABQ8PGJ5_9FUNG|nr:hypothetical protein EDC05_005043 [Coemansia umbellata]